MKRKLTINVLIATMLLGWLPQFVTVCLASMADCATCCCSCCADKSAAPDDQQNTSDSNCCITVSVEAGDQAALVKPDTCLKVELMSASKLRIATDDYQRGHVRLTRQHAQGPPGPPLRMMLCSWLI